MTSDSGLTVWREDPDVLRVRLDRPEARNAQTPQMWRALRTIAAELDPRIAFVVIDGAAPDFSAGLDRALLQPSREAAAVGEASLVSLARGSDEELASFIEEAQAAFGIWRTVDAHVIAVVRGHAIGAGFQLALAADLLVVHPEATLVLREVEWGIIPDLGAAAALLPTVGYSRALALEGGIPISGRTAERWGLAICAADPPEEAAVELIGRLRKGHPGARRMTKQVLRSVGLGSDPWVTEREGQMARLRSLLAESTP